MALEAPARDALPASVPDPIREIAGLRALFRYRAGWRRFFLPHDLIPADVELTVWVALHDAGNLSIARAKDGGATIVLDDIPSRDGAVLIPNAFGGIASRRLVKATLQTAGLDAALAGRLAPGVNVEIRDAGADAHHHLIMDGSIYGKPLEIAAGLSQHVKRAIARQPETVFVRLA